MVSINLLIMKYYFLSQSLIIIYYILMSQKSVKNKKGLEQTAIAIAIINTITLFLYFFIFHPNYN
jgi:hypothetical protein